MKPRNILVVGALVLGSGVTGATVAQAASTPVYSTSTTVKYVYSPKCIHTHTHTIRFRSYSSKAGRYVLLVKPSVTNSDAYKCHS